MTAPARFELKQGIVSEDIKDFEVEVDKLNHRGGWMTRVLTKSSEYTDVRLYIVAKQYTK